MQGVLDSASRFCLTTEHHLTHALRHFQHLARLIGPFRNHFSLRETSLANLKALCNPSSLWPLLLRVSSKPTQGNQQQMAGLLTKGLRTHGPLRLHRIQTPRLHGKAPESIAKPRHPSKRMDRPVKRESALPRHFNRSEHVARSLWAC